MENLDDYNFKVFQSIPGEYVDQVDKLLKEIDSNHRIKNDASLSEESKEMYDSNKDAFKYILTLDKEKVVGLVILYKREIIFKDRKLILGGFGGVGTKSKYRGRGIANKMMEITRKLLQEESCDIAHIDVDMSNLSLLRLYGKIGFVPLGRQFTFIGRSGKRYYSNDGMLAPILSQKLFEEVMKDRHPFDIYGGNW